jgi:hypothetical protein
LSATSSNTSASMPTVPVSQTFPSLQPYFTPTTFKVHHDKDRGITTMQPIELIKNIARRDMTVEHLSFELFWKTIQSQSGLTFDRHQLWLEVPGDPGQTERGPVEGVDGECKMPKPRCCEVVTVRVWRAALQRCHEAGWRECNFWLLEQDAVELAARKEAARKIEERNIAAREEIEREEAARRASEGAGGRWYRFAQAERVYMALPVVGVVVAIMSWYFL